MRSYPIFRSLSLAFLLSAQLVGTPVSAMADDIETVAPIGASGCSKPKPQSGLKKGWNWAAARLVASIEGERETRLDAQNVDTKLPIASITKMMTAYLVLKEIRDGHLSPDTRIPVSKKSLQLPDSCFAVAPLPRGIRSITVADALTHLIFLSSNPMAENLAVAVAGDRQKFVKMMNEQAQSWGMSSTRFLNPHGLPVGDRKSEYTTASDLLVMARQFIPHLEEFRAYENRPLAVDDKPLDVKTKDWKKELIESGVLFKTATVKGCSSLLTISQPQKKDESALVTIHLCGGKKEELVEKVKSWIMASGPAPQSSSPNPS